jgi:hypothetical protein
VSVAKLTFLLFVIGSVIAGAAEAKKRSKMTPNELKNYEAARTRQSIINKWGNLNSAYICSHCQTKGFVHTKPVTRKKGISGGKATGALLTGGLSILATGLSRKVGGTQAHCTNCSSTWDF